MLPETVNIWQNSTKKTIKCYFLKFTERKIRERSIAFLN